MDDRNNNNNNNNNSSKESEYHYYVYGRTVSDREPRQPERTAHEAPVEAEMTPPRELRTYPMVQTSPKPPAPPHWSYSEPKPPRRSGFKSIVASFLAGALVVGSLMFASDRMNLFSGGDAISTSGGAGAAAESSSNAAVSANGGSSVTTAALETVRPNTIAELVDVASPAVVKIVTYANQRTRAGSSLFDQFFGIPEQRQQPNAGSDSLVQVGSGSGFFFDKEGYILTNEHVINGAEKVEVIVEGTKEPYVAEVLGTAYDLDLAVLKVTGGNDFPTLPLGNSNDIRVGDWVVAIGNPYEFDHTVTVGVLSAKEREINISDSEGTRSYQTLLQTDASINPGNSGGPLLNLNGEVIGINTAVNAQAQGIGFAIPTSTILEVLDALKADKAIPRPFIGISMADVPEEYVDDLQLKNADGAFIGEVVLGSPAYKAGLQQYDVVTGADGTAIKSADELKKYVAKKKPGDKIALDVVRNGQTVQVTVTVGDRNEMSRQ
ncbi:S1C family serine protease [Paenibacillus sp.]|uniref:S1C family serine protease n=1 Tax=Paenibacillus sp. TaxID=58172 RepID=UPI002D41D867|nr:trypsin-like peptidase domain-containing protein [Paenibacillus sp.]HZG83738.1 trypsin-like peptidase domain-containing protein [Paenibacillus sp.]